MPDLVPSVPEELVQVATRALDEWPWRTGSLTISTGMLARAVLSAVAEAGWSVLPVPPDPEPYTMDNLFHRLADESLRFKAERDEARAQAGALAGALESVLRDDATAADSLQGAIALRAFRESREPDHAA